MSPTYVDEVYVSGLAKPGRVLVSVANVVIDMNIAQAREMAKLMLVQADVAELEAMR